jgi:purine catabolism regulator
MTRSAGTPAVASYPPGTRDASAWGDVAALRTLSDAAPHGMTVADLLELEVLQRGRPDVLSGSHLGQRPVRWVHTSEIYEISPLLKGGEVLLTTGLGLVGAGPTALADYARALGERSIAALVLELGRTFTAAPGPLLAGARESGLPLITLRGIVPFVEITETVHAMLISREVARLRLARRVDTVVTTSLVSGAGLGELLRDLARLAECPVRLYGMDGHVVAASDAAAGGAADIPVDDEPPGGWPQAAVELRSHGWGRLVVHGPATIARELVAERGAAAVAIELGRAGPGSGPSRRRAGALLLRDLFGRQYSSVDDVSGRAAALGLAIRPTSPAVGICLFVDRPGPRRSRTEPGETTATPAAPQRSIPPSTPPKGGGPPRAGSVVDAVADAAEKVLGPALVTEIDGSILIAAADGRAGAGDTRQRLDDLADSIDAALPGGRAVAVVCGPVATDVTALARSLRVAREASVLARRLHSELRTLRHTDLGVHRLISRFASDPELAAFVEEQLGPLIDYDATHGRELVRTLDTLLACGLSKAETARALHIRRQTLYQRLDTIGKLLGGIDLTTRERRTSLDLALVGWRLRTAGSAPPRDPGARPRTVPE